MKKYILYFIVFTAFNIHAFAQKYHVNEDFNAGVLPTDWENNALSGSDVWGFGIDGSSATHSGNQNLDGTSMAFLMMMHWDKLQRIILRS